MTREQLGWDSFFEKHFLACSEEGFSAGRVSLEHKNLYTVLTEQGELPALLTGKMHYEALAREDLPAVGDWVLIRILDEDPPKAIIHGILPRKSKFSRKEPGAKTREQLVAANVDQVLIVTGLDGNYSVRRIERYLALAWESGASPVVVLSKADLCVEAIERVREVEAAAPGVPVVAVSVFEGTGMDTLRDLLRPGKTLALLGSSGVGKSTILNHLLGEETQRTQEVREDDSKGRHTTTHRQLFVLPSGGLVIDTPGMRELQLWNADDGLSETFHEIEILAQNCRFADCRHENEPGCAVREALGSGALDERRFENYLRMRRELDYLARKQDRNAEYAEKMKWKTIAKSISAMKKNGQL